MGGENPRLTWLNGRAPQAGSFVLYWMDRAQRAEANHALELAAFMAERNRCPVLVVVRLGGEEPAITRRQAKFMAEGLQELAVTLAKRGIGFLILPMAQERQFRALLAGALIAVTDTGYLRHHRKRRDWLGDNAPCPAVAVDTDCLVPVKAASGKAEYAARTIRPKIERQIEAFLKPILAQAPGKAFGGICLPEGIDPADLEAIAEAAASGGPEPVDWIAGGHAQAERRLTAFLARDLAAYDEERADPNAARVSILSPYLRFGQISPLEIALRATDAGSDAASFLEELVVRRELAANWCHYRDDYDSYGALPGWARATLAKHAGDRRDPAHTAAEMEDAKTGDEAWNAAMRQMKATGYLHNRLRMYWAKQILRWAASPELALATILDLNNRYFLDGGDHNSFANGLWVLGLHDRPFQENEVYGTVRPMTRSGLERKFDVKAYIRSVG